MFGLYIYTGLRMAGVPNAVKFGQGQKFNKDGRPPKLFEGALRRALAQEDGKAKTIALHRIANALVREAEAGNIQAIKEIADRTDGKVPQAMDMSGDLNITHGLREVLSGIPRS